MQTVTKEIPWLAMTFPFVVLCGCHTGSVGTSGDAGSDGNLVITLGGPDVGPDLGPDVVAKDAPSAADVATSPSDVQPDRKPDTADAGICKHELTNPACWASFDITRWTGITEAFRGAIFDGTYVNFFNDAYGTDAVSYRYNTTKPFTEDASWSGFSTYGYADEFSTEAFDGRYIYLIPAGASNNGAAGGTYDDLIGRLDSQASKLSASAWSSLDVTKVSGTADLTIPGYFGGAFDGRYLYFAPYAVGDKASGKAMRYDTQAALTASTSWSWFDTTTVAADAKGFAGALFDGRYLYFIPNSSAVNPFTGDYTPSGVVVRYDTKAEFADAASWSTFDTGTLTPAARGFAGATFDGRYIYMAPNGDWTKGVVPTRYDTKGSFTDPSSWRSFDLSKTTVAGGDFVDMYFYGASFDGRYVYYIPGDGTVLVRYDTQADFSSASAWESVGMWAVGASSGFRGAAFDGQYLYLVPRDWGPIMRFDAVSPSALPGGNGASFF